MVKENVVTFNIDIEKVIKKPNIMLIGMPYSGKTRSFLTMPIGTALMINIEDNIESIGEHLKDIQDAKGIWNIYVDYTSPQTAYDTLSAGLFGDIKTNKPGIVQLLKKPEFQNKYKAIFIDSLTKIGEIVMAYYSAQNFKYGKDVVAAKDNMEKIMKSFEKLGYPTVNFAHITKSEKIVKGENGNESVPVYAPNILGNKKYDENLVHDFPYVFMLEKQGDGPLAKHILHTRSTNIAYAQCKKEGAIPATVQFRLDSNNPSGWDYIFKSIEEYDNKVIRPQFSDNQEQEETKQEGK